MAHIRHYAAMPGSRHPSFAARDTLDEVRGDLFLREELEALLSSPVISSAASVRRAANSTDSPEDDEIAERETEPSVDVKLIREALAAAS